MDFLVRRFNRDMQFLFRLHILLIVKVRDLYHGIKVSCQKNYVVGALEVEVSQKIRLKWDSCSSFWERNDEIIIK